MSSSTIGVVCDAGPLIHLDELNCLSLLNDFDPILVPVQIWQEVAAHRGEALVHSDLHLQRVNVVISSTPTFQTLVQSLSLDLGEQAALTLMESHPPFVTT